MPRQIAPTPETTTTTPSPEEPKDKVVFGEPSDPSLVLLGQWIASGCTEASWTAILEASKEPCAPRWMSPEALSVSSSFEHQLLCYCLAHACLPAPGGGASLGKPVTVKEALEALRMRGPMEILQAYDLLRFPSRHLHSHLTFSWLDGSPSLNDFLEATLQISLSQLRLLMETRTAAADEVTIETLYLPSTVRRQVERLLASPPAPGASFWVGFVGPAGSGRRTLGRVLARTLGREILPAFESAEPSDRMILGVGQDDGGYWDRDPRLQVKEGGWVFFRINGMGDPYVPLMDLVLDLSEVDPMARRAFAQRKVQRAGLEISSEELQTLVDRYPLAPALLSRGIELAARKASLANAHPGEASQILEKGLQSIQEPPPQRHNPFRMGGPDSTTFIEKVVPKLRRSDLILPPGIGASLDRFIRSVRSKQTLQEAWGLDKHLLASSKGVFLFHGPSGTGKSMAAEVMAAELGLNLWRIQASQLQSAFVGETEHAISDLFKLLRTSQAVALLDEADTFLLERSQEDSSIKSYHQGVVNTFLRELDTFEGLMVLTTNHAQELDAAIERRIPYRLSFPLPGEPERLAIWRNLWKETIPQDGSVDLNEIARRFPLPGGLIRNAFLSACQLGAESGRMTQALLIAACQEEHESRLRREASRKIKGFAA